MTTCITDGMTSPADITGSLQAAFAAGRATGKTVHIGDGDWSCSAPLVQDGFAVRGESQNTHLMYTGDTAPAGAAYTLSDTASIDGRVPTLRDITLTGAWRGRIGDPLPGLLGIRVLCAARIDGVYVGNFKAGVVDDSYAGHVYLTACKLSDNGYGLYTRNRNGDTRILNCDLTGNTVASCGMTPVGGLQNSSIIGTHMGFSPYVFFKEGGAPADGIGTTFLGDLSILDSPAEAVGNAYAWSDYAYHDGGTRDEVRNLTITRPGFTRNAAYRDTRRPVATFHGDFLRGVVNVTQGDNPLAPAPGGRLLEFALPFPDSVFIDGRPVETVIKDGRPVPGTGLDSLRTFLPPGPA